MALAGAVAGFFFGRWYNDNKRPNFTERYVLFVRPDTPVQTVIDSLVNGAGALRPRSLERCFEKEGLSDKMKPGARAGSAACRNWCRKRCRRADCCRIGDKT